MSHRNKSFAGEAVRDQVHGIVVDSINQQRAIEETLKLAAQDQALEKALEQIDVVREFLGSPQNILGSDLTKHGEIAESCEVGIRNARSALNQQEMTATFEGVGRTGPVDFIIDGLGVQSKFINGIPNNLSHVIKHLDTYPSFTSGGNYYIIPKDSYEAIRKIAEGGHVEGLKASTEEKIRALVQHIEQQTGKNFTEVVQASVNNYADVQTVVVDKTLSNEADSLGEKNEKLKDVIREEHRPSLEGMGQAAFIGAGIGGFINLGMGIYQKHKEGKKLLKGDFTAQDWKEIGVSTASGAASGGVSSAAIYGLTNFAGMSAPLASAVVTAVKGMGSLLLDLNAGRISSDEFCDLSITLCAETAIVGAASVLGQTLIPVPVLGAVIGSFTGKLITQFFGKQGKELADRMRGQIEDFKRRIDRELATLIDHIDRTFDELGRLVDVAFDKSRNVSLMERSVDLARHLGVSEAKIILTEDQLDKFMMG